MSAAVADHRTNRRTARRGRRRAASLLAALLTTSAALTGLGLAAPAQADPDGVPPSGEAGSALVWGEHTVGNPPPTPPPPSLVGTPVVAVSSGGSYDLALTAAGRIVWWGVPCCGTNTPPTRSDIAAISAGLGHALALTSSGELLTWGGGAFGLPKPARGHTYVAISAGRPNLAITTSGRVVAWNTGSPTPAGLVPSAVTSQVVTAVSAGLLGSLAVTSAGKVLAWDGTGLSEVPASLDNEVVTAVAQGFGFSLALTAEGRVVAWGDDAFGQTDVPTSLSGRRVTAISASTDTSAAVTDDGHVVTWGRRSLDPPAYLQDDRITAVSTEGTQVVALASPVGDYSPPVITGIRIFRVAATSPAGATVDYALPVATDAVDGPVPVTCDPPPGSFLPIGSRSVTCVATDSAGNSTTWGIEVVVQEQVPVVESVSPARGPTAGGPTVIVTGHGFGAAGSRATVYFGATFSQQVHVESDGRLSAVVPPHAAGFVHVRVISAGGTSRGTFSDRFHYLDPAG